MKTLNFDKPTYDWVVYRGKDFNVTIHSWGDFDKHHWNVYAHIFDTHPFFNAIDKALDLHFHGGVTYDALISHVPAQGIRYEWQKEFKHLKVGSDYSHLHDDWFADQDPALGVPLEIQSDAAKLVEQLINLTTNSEVETL